LQHRSDFQPANRIRSVSPPPLAEPEVGEGMAKQVGVQVLDPRLPAPTSQERLALVSGQVQLGLWPVGYGNPGVACELEVRSSLGFGALILFVHVEAP
jgi:hypothetical protein